jgi:KaiC/GvpD/RAD55 family RecA-like ATPase
VKSTIEAIKELTFGEHLPSGITLLSGKSGCGKTIFCQQFSYEMLREGARILWITTEELPQTLRDGMKTFGWNVDKYESEGKLAILDAASPARLGFSENIGHGMLGLDPTGMLIVITEQLKSSPDSKGDKFLLIVDSISRLLLSCDPKAVIDFVSCLSSRMENFGARGFVTVSEEVHEEKLLNSLIFSTSGTVRFRIIEEEMRQRQLRIEMLRGKKHDDKWKKYVITNSGLDIEL